MEQNVEQKRPYHISKPQGFMLVASLFLVVGVFVTVNFSMQQQETRGRAASGDVSLLFDNFEDGNALGWTVSGGTWAICHPSGETLEFCKKDTGTNLVMRGSPWKDYSIQSSVFLTTDVGSVAVLARVQDSTHYYSLELKKSSGIKKWYILKTNGSTVTTLASGSINYPLNAYFRPKLDVRGNTLTAYFSTNGGATWTYLGSAVDTQYPGGKIGLKAGGMPVRFDNTTVSGSTAIYVPPTNTPVPPPPTATPKPTATPTLAPVIPTNTPIPTPTNPPAPTSTPVPGSTTVTVTLGLHGIGTGGDSVNPNSVGNTSPARAQRTINLELFNAQNQLVLTKQATVLYNSGSGKFIGSVNLGQIPSGVYIAKIKADQYLRGVVTGIQTITAGQTTNFPPLILVAGDVNGDNQVNIVDFNLLIGCYSDLLPAIDCSPGNNTLTDLNDDGNVNQFDYNLFLRELTNVGGQ